MLVLSDHELCLKFPDLPIWTNKADIFVDEQKIGAIGFQGMPGKTDWTEEGESLYGISLDEEWRGKGYGTRAARLLLAEGFKQGLKAAIGHTNVTNLPAVWSMAKHRGVLFGGCITPNGDFNLLWRITPRNGIE